MVKVYVLSTTQLPTESAGGQVCVPTIIQLLSTNKTSDDNLLSIFSSSVERRAACEGTQYREKKYEGDRTTAIILLFVKMSKTALTNASQEC